MMSSSVPYIPGTQTTQPEPLSRFLPPIPVGVVKEWLKVSLPLTDGGGEKLTGDTTGLILDPFGAAPRIAIEAARAGYRVLVSANNPITRFILMMASNPPSKTDLRSALAELGAARKGEDRLEPHIRSLYTSSCGSCDNQVMAEAFIWERVEIETRGSEKQDNFNLIAKIYQCQHCGESGEFPITDSDSVRAKRFPAKGLHYARALERVTPIDDPDRKNVTEALETYLPRAIYATFTIINNLDALDISNNQRDHLIALLLTTLDRTNNLWTYPSGRARPRQLTISPRFYEYNVWLALEKAIDLWARVEQPLPLSSWPDLPPQNGGICVFEGRLKNLVNLLHGTQIDAVVTAVPRPNQAFWTLSALWAGWLWGKESIGTFKSVLRRRRYDWAWHSTALMSAFDVLTPILEPGTPFFGIIGETEPGFVSAAMVAADMAKYDLSGLAMRSEGLQSQFHWRLRESKINSKGIKALEWTSIARDAAITHINERGEPVPYLDLHTAAISALANANAFYPTESPGDNISQINLTMEDALSPIEVFNRLGGSEKSLEVGKWWLYESSDFSSPLSDRVEMAVVNHLLQQPASTLLEIDAAICELFPGLLTPNAELLQVCLSSYGQQRPSEGGKWKIRPGDLPDIRRNDIEDISELITQLGDTLGYNIEGGRPILWRSPNKEVHYAFYIIASAIISDIVFNHAYPPEASLLILPGGRANLMAYKLANDAHLKIAIERGWRFMKFRLVRWMGENPVLNRIAFEEHIAKETLTYESPQLRLL
jgi:hypothetical protein